MLSGMKQNPVRIDQNMHLVSITMCRQYKTKQLLVAVLMCFTPIAACADCGSAPNDGWDKNYPSYAEWCSQCGGTPYNTNGVGCTPGSNWGGSGSSSGVGSYSGGGYSPQLAVAGALGYSLGYAIGQWLVGGGDDGQSAARAEAARLREQARLLEEERLRQEAEAERVRLLELKKKELLKEMKGGYNSGELTPKGFSSGELAYKTVSASRDLKYKNIETDNSACLKEDSFPEYVRREEEIREMREKLSKCPPEYTAMKIRADWCKLNVPLAPSPAASGYCGRKPVYEARMKDWRGTCNVVMEMVSTSKPGADLSKTAANKSNLPEAIAYCMGVYDGALQGCHALECVNKSIHVWHNCLDGYASASKMAASAPASLKTSPSAGAVSQNPASANASPVRKKADTQDSMPTEEDLKLLFPEKPNGFPKNPDKPLLNLINEREKSAFLPQRGESEEDYENRFLGSEAYKKIDPVWYPSLADNKPNYPRGKYPDVDKVMDESLRQIGEHREVGIHTACQKAADDMKAEYDKMEAQGLIHPGENLKDKELNDVAFEKAILPVRKRVYEQLNQDVWQAVVEHEIAFEKLEDTIAEMQVQNGVTGAAFKSVMDSIIFQPKAGQKPMTTKMSPP